MHRLGPAAIIDPMPPTLALLLWLILLLALLWWDPAKDSGTSLALWVPVIWMFIQGSRLPSQWLGGQMRPAAQAFEEGDPLDRTVFLVLILLAIGILMSRSFQWGRFFTRNWALTAFLFFALVSVCWSDFPFVAFKRWFRDLGNYLVIMVVLSDPRPLEAVRAVLRRLGYLLVPLSIVLIKYYSYMGIHYSYFTGEKEYVGAATSKNMLGLLCLVCGLFFFWDTVTWWRERKQRRTRRIIVVNLAFLAMTLWLLNLSNSATSRVCLVLGCLIIAAAHTRTFRRNPAFVKVLIPACFCAYLILAFAFNINGELAGAVGRDPTLHDRTKIWGILLGMHTNPLVGTGYESFWLGPRIEWFARTSGLGFLNEAHNGYLEVYLNLGLIGLALLIALLIVSYRTICRNLDSFSGLGSLALALWTIILFYSVTEAGFRGGLMWLTFLLGAISIRARGKQTVHTIAASNNTVAAEQFPLPGLETTSVFSGPGH
jgi:exopolysaccharide production protein ExoQ